MSEGIRRIEIIGDEGEIASEEVSLIGDKGGLGDGEMILQGDEGFLYKKVSVFIENRSLRIKKL